MSVQFSSEDFLDQISCRMSSPWFYKVQKSGDRAAMTTHLHRATHMRMLRVGTVIRATVLAVSIQLYALLSPSRHPPRHGAFILSQPHT
ncbi:hypothetical protein K491DRAFT_697584 [Lophiostoma macrostomum CBS 122681]|uniref:Uncharacterized protein n=1 Tax=Lophiostoma macrostomum CBS 122681 TaxID=1314788 RepID=A0A6A6SQI7_9PLEO|nr:hypothetical protein K491DRAFT_697584 [Lophiostoma macrostomum CBS 122681]